MKLYAFNLLFLFTLGLLLSSLGFAENEKKEKQASPPNTLEEKIHQNRIKIGPTFSSPIEYKSKLYFLATSGVLYQSNFDQSEVEVLFEAKFPSLTPLTLDKNFVYFGEGIHETQNFQFYAYDLDQKKISFTLPLEGHMERPPLIHKGIAYVGMGPKGMAAIDLHAKKILWKKASVKAGNLHVDSNFILFNDLICGTSVYATKGIFCLNPKSGEELNFWSLNLSPKSEIGLWNNYLFGQATEGTMNDLNWKTPTIFYIVDLKKGTLFKKIELRGYNFFQPLMLENGSIFTTLSTGDLITIHLESGRIGYVGEFPEPLVSSAFKLNNNLCSVGIMGILLCYQPVKSGYALTKEKRYYETFVGKIAETQAPSIYIPSRIGFLALPKK